MDYFISPPPSAAGIIEHFFTIISLRINTEFFYKLNNISRCFNTLVHLLTQFFLLRAPFGGQGADFDRWDEQK